MARHHKYVKRTGSPGNYKYWYRMPDGSLKASDDEGSPKEHGKAKREHLRRLIQGKQRGHHRMSKQEMMNHTGVTKEELEGSGNKHLFANAARRGHQWEDHEVETAHHEEGGDKTGAAEESSSRSKKVTKKKATKKAKKKTTSRARAAEAEAESASATRAVRKKKAAKKAKKKAGSRLGREYRRPENAELFEGTDYLPQRGGGAKQHFSGGAVSIEPAGDGKWKVTAGSAEWDEEKSRTVNSIEAAIEQGDRYIEQGNRDHNERVEQQRAEAEAEAAGEGGEENVQSLLDKLRDEHGIDLGGGDEPAAEEAADEVGDARDAARARAAAARAQAVASPSSNAARDIHAEDPDLAAADEPIEAMEREASRGGNPYLSRAKQIYENIQGSLKEERRALVGHVLQSIENLAEEGRPLNEANLLEEYKSVSGKTRTRGLRTVGKEFEKGTFMTLGEIMNNEPINAETERMKRGYAAKQFARMKPFLKDSWKSANAGAPPPMPTFGDIKTWNEHGGPKPDWAGRTRTAVPKEVYDAAARGRDGKPKYPPPWMPIHMMPAWNYIVKKAESADANPYQTGAVSFQGGQMSLGAQASYQEGIAKAAIRKYVLMRGGANQLTDIPDSKLGEVGLTQSDIFKSEMDMNTDEGMCKVLCSKIVDPVALIPFIKQELHAYEDMGDEIGKSIRLVIDADKSEVEFKKSYTVELSKSEKIKRIKDLRRKFVVGK